jgi:hypothetical protein
MASTYNILPAELNIAVLKGDEFGMTVTFEAVDLTGYSWSSIVFETERVVNSQFPGGINVQGNTAATIVVSVVDAAAGELSLALTETQTAGMSEETTYRWFLRGVAPGDVTRTYVSGTFSVRAP